MNEYEILDKLKEKLLTNNNISNNMFNPKGFSLKHPTKAKYYFKDYKNNIYKTGNKMILDKNPARSIRNSAVMIYNLLGDNVIYNNKDYEITYEKELPVIKTLNRTKHVAHLDFFMKNKNELIFGEAKMLEYLSSPKYLKKAYLCEDSYFDKDDTIFIDIFKKFIKMEDNLLCDEYKSKYETYDAIQMLIHILGIYRYIKENNKIKNIKLINVVWGDNKILEYQKEEKEGFEFIKEANTIFKGIFSKKGINFQIEYYNYFDFKNLLTFTDRKREKYLERYNIF